MTRSACPTCGREIDPAVVVRHTGEFTVPALANHEDIARASARVDRLSPKAIGLADAVGVTGPTAKGPVTCSWCGKPEGEVRKLLSGPGVQICDGCIALCYMILRDELPDFGGSE
jgi:hypothetical protein